MAQIKIDLAETLIDGMDIKFKAPCACNEITGLIVYYPAEDETVQSKELFFRDAHGNDLTGIGNLFSKDAYVKIIADTVNGYAYLQNADNNGYLNSAIFGTYIHDAENLIGSGENGKFKATVTGTIATINVNGVACSVKCGEESSMDLIAGCWYTFILDGDTVNFNQGGAGGGGLNFKVVGGTTEPVSPSENMIWVNTDTPITGYEFSATNPSDPMEGMVWITVGASSTVAFNALKKNSIMVYPISAKQYASGAWVHKEVKIYQNGAWAKMVTYLYDNGNQCANLTGGWQGLLNAGSTNSKITVPFNTDNVKISSGSGAHSGVLTTKTTVDLSQATILTLNMVERTGSPYARFYVSTKSNTHEGAVAGKDVGTTGAASIDVSNLTGLYYVGVYYYSASAGSCTFDEVYYE